MKYQGLKIVQLSLNEFTFYEDNGAQWPDVFGTLGECQRCIDWFLGG